MLILFVKACDTGPEHESPVRYSRMITCEFFLTDEVDRCIVIGKIVRHRLDRVFDRRFIRTFLRNDKALPCMLLSCGKLGIVSAPYGLESFGNGYRILLRILHPGYPSDSIGMSLADALVPERVVITFGKYAVRIQSVQREHTRIPSCRYERRMTALLRCLVDIRKMLGYLSMCIETVYDIEIFCIFGCLLRKVRRASAAYDQNIYLILMCFDLIHLIHRDSLRFDLNIGRVSSREHARKLHIIILPYGTLNSSSEITVSEYSYFHDILLLPQTFARNVYFR